MPAQPARAHHPIALGAATALTAGLLVAPGADAAVTFTPFETLTEVLSANSRDERVVMMVISQRDWCPPCIALDTELLRNPEESELQSLTEDWVVIEVDGYDDPHAKQLKQHGLEFPGTPTTLVVQLHPDMATFREGNLLGSVVGYPEDYVDQIEAIAARKGTSVREMEAEASEKNDLDSWLAVADRYIERGQSSRARIAFRNFFAITEEQAKDMGVDSEAYHELRKNARWTLITRVYQRMMGDYAAARHALDVLAEEDPAFARTDEFVYADAWTEANLFRADQANGIMKNHFVDPGTADGLLTYLYFAFRLKDEEVWAEAEEIAADRIGDHPEHAAALHAAHGRLLRRLERGNDALAAFQAALDAAAEDDPKRATYLGQLNYLKANPIRLK